VWAVFGQTAHHEFVNYDDQIYVYDNLAVSQGLNWSGVVWAFKNLDAGFWHPLTWLSLMTDAQLYGLQAGGYHLTNVLFHAVNSLLLFFLLRRLTGAHWRSAFTAALFAVHPLHVESVAWISQRKDVLSAFFFLLSLWAYVCYAQGAEVRSQEAEVRSRCLRHLPSPIFYLLALVCFALGLMSKTVVVTTPVVMMLLDYWPLRRVSGVMGQVSGGGAQWPDRIIETLRLPSRRHLLLEKLPFFGLAFAAGLLTIHAERGVGALVSETSVPFEVRIGNAALSSVRYLWQTVWPTHLAVHYPLSIMSPVGLVSGSLLLLALISLVVLRMRRNHSYLVVGWFWYLLTLAPMSGLIQIGVHSRADRYTYIPLVGIFLMAVWGLAELCGRWRYRRAVLGMTAVTILAGLTVVSHVQTAYWRSSRSLWTHTLACTSGNFIAHYNLGIVLANQGKWIEAIEHYEQAVQLNPNFFEAHDSLGVALSTLGKLPEAIQHHERALQLKPDFAEAHFNLGRALAKQGKPNEAIEHYKRALQLKPDLVEAHYNLGSKLAAQGKWSEAIEHYERALQFKPDDADIHNNLGAALAAQGNWAGAIEHCKRALQLKPDFAEAHYNLGHALLQQGRTNDGLEHFQRALDLATAQGHAAVAETIRTRLKSYQSGLPKPQTP